MQSMQTPHHKGFSFFLISALGFGGLLFFGSALSWGWWPLVTLPGSEVPPLRELTFFVLLLGGAYWGATFLGWKYLRYPRVGRFPCLLLSSLPVWGVGVLCIAMFRLYYSRSFLMLGVFLQLGCSFLGYRLFLDPSRLHFGVIPGGIGSLLVQKNLCHWHLLTTPRVPDFPVDGMVADLHQGDLSPAWLRTIAECSLKNIPLFHAARLFENLTGRISLEHMGKELLHHMARPRLYSFLKRPFDVAVLLCTLPVTVPLFCAVALGVRLGMGSPVFFRQERVGQGGKPFSILKFRSLHTQEDGSMHLCRVGRFLRRHRLDELPQLVNVLRGEMSLVGPRPEQVPLVSKYEEAIPFYAFRETLRPGITGWAQVCWEHSGDTGDTRIKLEYDLFYLKHLSFWMDLLILAKTCRTMLLGLGSRDGRAL